MKEQKWAEVFIPGLGTCGCMTLCFLTPLRAPVLTALRAGRNNFEKLEFRCSPAR